jgi:MtN3 and saliva related transmembrane protein
MTTTTLLAIVASSWGIAMALAPTLQIRHMVAIRSSAGISIPYLAVLVFGFALWFAYGVALHNWALILPNTVAFVVGATTIAVARHFRRTARL